MEKKIKSILASKNSLYLEIKNLNILRLGIFIFIIQAKGDICGLEYILDHPPTTHFSYSLTVMIL